MKREIVLSVLGMMVFPLTARAQQPGTPFVKVRIENGRIVSPENSATMPASEQIQEENRPAIIQEPIDSSTNGPVSADNPIPSGSLLLANLTGLVGVTDGTGPDIVFGYSISNGGNSTASGFHVYIVLSPDITISPDDILIADYVRSLPPMNISDVNSIQADVGQVDAGTYYLGIYVDATYLIAESNEDDNTGYDDSPQVVIEALPDLEVTNLSLDAIEWNGLMLTYSCEVHNRGNVSVNCYQDGIMFSLYLSLDTNIEKESDYLYRQYYLTETLAPGQVLTMNHRHTQCDGYYTEGTYYLGVYIDRYENLAESREFNNTAVETDPQVIVPEPLPDLSWGGSPVSYDHDEVSFTVINLWNYGWDDITDPFSYRIAISSDQSLDEGDHIVEETFTDGIERMNCIYLYPRLSVEDIPAGTYYVIFQADVGNQITEYSESNNTMVRGPFDIVHLRMVYPNGGETWVKGNTYTIGWASEGAISYVELQLLKGDLLIWIIGSILPNTGSRTFTPAISLADGSDYKIRICEYDDQRSDDVSDNYFTIQTTAPPAPKPDLVVQTIEVLDGEGPEIRYQCTVRNSGDAAAGESKVKFYLSSDTQISSSDHLVDSWTVTGTLYAGESRSSGERTTTVSGVPAGEYYLGAIADAEGR